MNVLLDTCTYLTYVRGTMCNVEMAEKETYSAVNIARKRALLTWLRAEKEKKTFDERRKNRKEA